MYQNQNRNKKKRIIILHQKKSDCRNIFRLVQQKSFD